MRIDIRPVAKLRGGSPVNVPAALGPLFDALTSTAVNLSTLRVVCDWIQYRNNFSEPVQCRPVLAERPPRPATGDAQAAEIALEIGIDLRRCGDADMATTIKTALAEHANPETPRTRRELSWSRGCPPAKAASGGSTRSTGRR